MPRKVIAGSIFGSKLKGSRSSAAARRVAVLGAVVAGSAVFAAPAAQAALTNGPLSPATGFPSLYADDNGVQLGLCLGPDPFCPTAPPAADLTAPDGEAFWSLASATVDDPNGTASFTIAFDVEAAFLDPSPNSQISFGRVQVNMTGAQGNGVYTITHPYGQDTWTAEPDGTLLGGKASAQRHEVGCAGPPCDFAAVSGSEISSFLTWDPGVAPAAPTGYVGDGVSEHAVVGSPTNTNSVTVTGPGLPPGGISTNLFTVEGKLAGPATPIFFVAAGSGDYGTQRVGTSANRPIVVKNNGTANGSNITSAVISGPDAGQFTKGTDGCSNPPVALASGASCTINVSFNPNGVGARNATLTVTDGDGPHTVPLTGAGGLPGVTTSPAIVNFLNQNVSTTSPEQQATVRNTGSVPLNVTGAAVSGPNASEFAISNNGCGAPVAPNGTCTIGMKFLPSAGGVRNAMLDISSDAPGSPHHVPLTGAGTGPGAGGGGAGGGQAGNGPADAGTSSKPLTLGLLSISKKIKRSKVRKSGLRIVTRLNDGTQYLRLRIYRKKRNGSKSLLAQGFRVTHTAGLYRTKLIDPKMRRDMSVGSYELEVTPGRSRDDLGTPAKYAFKVVK